MKNKILILLCSCFVCCLVNAQTYTDYVGAGHNIGVTVTTSHDQNPNNDGSTSVDGFPVTNPDALADASRFLAQATLGYNYEMIQMTAAMGYEAWLDEQFSLPRLSMMDHMLAVANTEPEFDDEGNITASMYTFRSAWWEQSMRNPDALRHKINYALSQIFVISAFGSDLFEDIGQLSASYYDVLGQHAFGNYRNLLNDVSLHPSMGLYLNHMNNPKSDPANNIHPDENYAREVMQLFSIGLYELNPDGTRILDGDDNFIPTYNNNDIREFAKVFTGFGDGHPEGAWGAFSEGNISEAATIPMKLYPEYHETGPKYLLNGQVVPAGQSGTQDFSDAIDNLHNHPNIGPFIGKAMIQFLISSNPSPEFVGRITEVFNDNGQGIRGDMQAVVKAILLDPEARDCNAINQPTSGKLREPIIRYTNFLSAFNVAPIELTFNSFMNGWHGSTGQIPLFSPSVFNFYQPEFQPNGPIASQDLFAPVFQIHNSSTSIGYINKVDDWVFRDAPMVFEANPDDPEEEEASAIVDLSAEIAIANDPTALVDRLNILLAAGQLSDNTKTIIIDAITSLTDPAERVDLAIYLVLISPDYAILK